MMLHASPKTDHSTTSQFPAEKAQNGDCEAQIPLLLGVLGGLLGRKGDYALGIVCPVCGRTNLHGWDPRLYPPDQPQHRRAHCGCHPRGYLVLPETRPLIGGCRGR